MVRRLLLRLRLPAGDAGAGALFDAAGAAQRHHRAQRHRSRADRSRERRRHDGAAVAGHGRAAAGTAGDDGRHPHRRRVGDRHRDAVDADRADQPRQLHFCGATDPELGVRAVRLLCLSPARARRRSAAWPDRERPAPSQPPPRRARRDRDRGAGCGDAGADDGTFVVRLCGRRKDLRRAIRALGAARGTASRPPASPPRRGPVSARA